MNIQTLLQLIGTEGMGMSIHDLLTPIPIDWNDGIEPWRLGVQPKPIIYHNPLLKQKFIKIFKGHYFSIGDYT